MKTALAVVAMATALAGCASSETAQRVAANPHHHCRQEGLVFGTEAFARCVDTVIAERCPANAGRSERCAERLRDAAFLTQQLELRGYRLFSQSS